MGPNATTVQYLLFLILSISVSLKINSMQLSLDLFFNVILKYFMQDV